LTLYLPGLSPLLSSASLSVKPALLSLFETFIVNLDPEILQPALKAIVLALLPGLEEETSEEFERTHTLLNKFRFTFAHSQLHSSASTEISSDRYFWQSLFLAMITSPSRRQGALAYLDRDLPRLGAPSSSTAGLDAMIASPEDGEKSRLSDEIEAVISPEPGLLIRCFAAGLQDEQLLIQRGFLDLLVTHLPLNSIVLHQRVVREDVELLVSAAAAVVARREMSLNRRLWVWFLGPDASSDVEANLPSSPDAGGHGIPSKADEELPNSYFQRYGLGPLVHSLRKMVHDIAAPPLVKAKPFRICLSLMDRWEIGSLVIPQMFGPAMESIRSYEGSAPSKEAFAEVLRSANVFFDGIQSSLIWSEIVRMLLEALDIQESPEGKPVLRASQQRLDLVWFIVTKFNIREEEMLTVHLPMALVVIVICLRVRSTTSTNQPTSDMSDLEQRAFQIAVHLLDMVPDRIFIASTLPQTSAVPANTAKKGQRDEPRILEEIRHFYGGLDQNVSIPKAPFSGKDTGDMLLRNAASIVTEALQEPHQQAHFDTKVSLLDKLVRAIHDVEFLDRETLLSTLSKATSKDTTTSDYDMNFPFILALASVVETLHRILPPDEWESDHRVRQIFTRLIMNLWAYISPSQWRHSVEAVRCLWRLHLLSPDSQLVESSITTLMLRDENSKHNQSITLDGARCFASLWTHSSTAMLPSSNRRSSLRRASTKASQTSDKAHEEADCLARPLFLVLDSLRDPNTELCMFTVSWLRSLHSLQM